MLIMSLDIVINQTKTLKRNIRNIRNNKSNQNEIARRVFLYFILFYCDLCRRYCEKVKLIKQKVDGISEHKIYETTKHK